MNVIGPLLLTQGIAKQMVKRGEGRIVWVSSREGLNVNSFTGIYAASKHAVEAIAETIAFPRAQFDPEPVYATMTAVAAGEIDTYRNLERKSMIDETKRLIEAPWNRKTNDGLGKRRTTCRPHSTWNQRPLSPTDAKGFGFQS